MQPGKISPYFSGCIARCSAFWYRTSSCSHTSQASARSAGQSLSAAAIAAEPDASRRRLARKNSSTYSVSCGLSLSSETGHSALSTPSTLKYFSSGGAVRYSGRQGDGRAGVGVMPIRRQARWSILCCSTLLQRAQL